MNNPPLVIVSYRFPGESTVRTVAGFLLSSSTPGEDDIDIVSVSCDGESVGQSIYRSHILYILEPTGFDQYHGPTFAPCNGKWAASKEAKQ